MSREYSILCVDDQPVVLKTLEKLLQMQGYKIYTAESGAAGLDILKEQPVDLIIADQRMPEMDGSEFLRRAREQRPEAIRIMLSAHHDFNNLVTAVNDGEIFRFLSKPWNNGELLDVLRMAFEKKEIVDTLTGLVKSIGDMTALAQGVTVESSHEQGNVMLRISDQGKVFSQEAVFNFLKLIFESFNVEQDTLRMVSGAVSRQEGKVIFTLDIGKGVCLQIEMPKMD